MAIITQPAELPKSAPLQPRQPDMAEVTSKEEASPKEASETQASSSPNMVAMARKERALRKQLQELKAEKDAFKAKEVEYETSYIPKAKLKERAATDPLGAISELGLSLEQITDLILNQPKPEDQHIRKLEEKLQALEAAQTQTKTKIEDDQKRAYDEAVKQIRNEAKLLIDSDSNFETIKEMGASEAVVELIKETHKEQGIILSVAEAAKEVEGYLVEEALRMAQFKKVREKLTPQEQAQEATSSEKSAPAPMRTLTNAMSASSKPLTNKERRQRAILAFQGQLK